MTTTHRVLMICGSLRKGSTSEAVLRTASTLLPEGVTASYYEGLAMLPHFNPDNDRGPLHRVVAELRAAIAAADALLICTPEYAGALPGSFKNLLDWTVGGVEIADKPTAWLNAAGQGSPNGGRLAHESLRTVLDYTGARIVDAACVRIPVKPSAIDADGIVRDEAAREQIRQALATLLGRRPGPIR
jgi:chromate reductase, NAD(P)H dehydrogenase (quinone)